MRCPSAGMVSKHRKSGHSAQMSRSLQRGRLRHRRHLQHRRRQLQHRHLQRQRRHQGAPIRTSIAKTGPPMENVRSILAGCWMVVLQAAVSALRQGAVVAADSEQTVGIVERMARGGATSQLPTVPSARAPSTRPVRPQPLAEARQRQTLSHRQILSRRRHLQQQRRRQDALMRISIAKIGPPTENVRRIPATCWNLVLRAAVLALRQSRVSMRTSIAQIGQPVENVRQTLATCWKLVLRAVVPALEAPAHHRNQLQLR